MEIRGPEAHRVYQRNEAGLANIPFEIELDEPCPFKVEIRLDLAGHASGWMETGMISDAVFRGIFVDVPAGQHCLEIRIVTESKAVVTSRTIDPVYVGDLWLLAGQSNMEGCGKLTDADSPQAGISCFYMGDTWGIARDPLCWPNESLDAVHWRVSAEEREQAAKDQRRDRSYGAGLGIPFAKELYRHTGVPVGLIMCADGGTCMVQWDAAKIEEGGRSLYGSMIRKFRKLGGKVKGVLWYQGEAEANVDNAPLYRDRMLSWVNSVRKDMGDPELPFIYAQLSVFYSMDADERGWNRIQHDQLALEESLEAAAMVPTLDGYLSDIIHLNAASLREVGRRMAWRALELAYGMRVAKPGPRLRSMTWSGDRKELVLELSQVNDRLVDAGKMHGFHVETADGHRLPLWASLAADGLAVLLRFERGVPPGCQLWHGAGLNPTVNVKDAKGIPLPMFGPVPLP